MIEIVKPGIQATIQDLGRLGFRKYGVGLSGAMDPFALAVANHLVGNDPNAAAIECTLGGIEIRFHADVTIAVAGADASASLDDVPLPAWWVLPARKGQLLKTGMLAQGMRFYIAVQGGFDVVEMMRSRSTDLKGRFGGLGGRMLRQGDHLSPLACLEAGVLRHGFGLSPHAIRALNDYRYKETIIRFVPAAEWGDLEEQSRELFLEAGWTVDPESNRMGYRLSGRPLSLVRRVEMLSHGILPGTIQLPPSGLPIIQLNDANTIGGYPKLGVVIAADMHRLGQTRLRGAIRFVPVGRDEAVDAMREHNALLQRIANICRHKRVDAMRPEPSRGAMAMGSQRD